MAFPTNRPRRLRNNPTVRRMVRENSVTPSDLMAPLFLVPGSRVKNPISSMPGQFQMSVDVAVDQAKRFEDLSIPSVLLFAIPEDKDEIGSLAWHDQGLVQQTVRALKEQTPNLMVTTDLCFCEYTSHGHCGIMKEGRLCNDETLEIIVKQSLSHARSGADMIAPSGMVDGAVGAIRQALDENGFTEIPIMGYSAKMASAFYGPFREAVQSAPQYGDRKTYQMDPANAREALRETALDIEEGADIVMVKPAMAFLDILFQIKEKFGLPTAAYNVSGEYALIKAAAEKGWVDGTRVMLETLTSIKRAGADIIITYFAEEFASLYKEGKTVY